jgi:hypothetical protein
MRYVLAIILLAVLHYILSFARHNWIKKNKLAAIGAAFIGISAIGLMCFVIFFSKYEM